MKSKKLWRRLFSFLYVLIFIAALLVTGSLVTQKLNGEQAPMVLGWGVARVLTGSMEPEIPVGALIVIKEQDSYGVGDVVTYENARGNSITHKIVAVEGDEIVTRGVANNAADEPFDASQIRGRVVFVVPAGGKILTAATALLAIVCLSFAVGTCFWCSKGKEVCEGG